MLILAKNKNNVWSLQAAPYLDARPSDGGDAARSPSEGAAAGLSPKMQRCKRGNASAGRHLETGRLLAGLFSPPLRSFFRKGHGFGCVSDRSRRGSLQGGFKSQQHLARGAASLAQLDLVLAMSQTFPAKVLRTQTPTLLGFALLRMLFFKQKPA